jgi:hypothetical protein
MECSKASLPPLSYMLAMASALSRHNAESTKDGASAALEGFQPVGRAGYILVWLSTYCAFVDAGGWGSNPPGTPVLERQHYRTKIRT